MVQAARDPDRAWTSSGIRATGGRPRVTGPGLRGRLAEAGEAPSSAASSPAGGRRTSGGSSGCSWRQVGLAEVGETHPSRHPGAHREARDGGGGIAGQMAFAEDDGRSKKPGDSGCEGSGCKRTVRARDPGPAARRGRDSIEGVPGPVKPSL